MLVKKDLLKHNNNPLHRFLKIIFNLGTEPLLVSTSLLKKP